MTKDTHHIVVVDDDEEMLSLLADFLQPQGYRVSCFNRATLAFKKVEELLARSDDHGAPEDAIDLVITDIRMPDMTGLEFLRQMQKAAPEIPVIIATGFGSIEGAIDAIRKGAYDYLTKPFKLSELNIVVDRAIEAVDLRRTNSLLRRQVNKQWQLDGLIGKCKAMQDVFGMVRRVAQTTSTVLVTGESGTGKEAIARAIHHMSPRSAKPFVAVNCAAIPASLLESELFGHAKGAFTGALHSKQGLFQEAHGGTLFLDEIGDMELPLQAKILRVLQDKRVRPVGSTQETEVDVRVIAATHRDLKAAIREKLFREDLYYRLAVLPIVVPSLRHRREDIPLLAQFFLSQHAARAGRKVRGFSTQALHMLCQQRWEGNVRELENVIERALVLSDSEWVSADDLRLAKVESPDTIFASASEELIPLEEFEKRYIRFVLDKAGGNKEKAAQILGINRRTLYRKSLADDEPGSEE